MSENNPKVNNLLSIGQLSKITNIPISTIRYYGEVGLFEPFYIDPETNYRYYAIRQMYDIDFILSWREIGFSISDVKKLLKDSSIENMIQLYERKEIEIKKKIRNLRNLKKSVLEYKAKLKMYNINKEKNDYIDLEVKKVPSVDVVFVSDKEDDGYITYRKALTKLTKIIDKYGLDIKDFSQIKSNAYEYPDKTIFETSIPLNRKPLEEYKFIKTEPEYNCVSRIHFGEYNQELERKYNLLKKWIQDNNKIYNGMSVIKHIIGTPITNDPKKFVAELQVSFDD